MKARMVGGRLFDLDTWESLDTTHERAPDGTSRLRPDGRDFLERAYQAEEARGAWPGQVWERPPCRGCSPQRMLYLVTEIDLDRPPRPNGRLRFDPRIGLERPDAEESGP